MAYIGGGLAFAVFLMRSFFKTLPTELIDAGRVDGASEFASSGASCCRWRAPASPPC